ncbi:ATP-binding protein [Streptomyces sp. DT171]|uniref:ATP-binding protein n=1 Tax=Streptomyces sp. DT171 TaxID=3416524 RepID=UPI003CF0439D
MRTGARVATRALRVTVTDDGPGGASRGRAGRRADGDPAGFGIVGMRERARSTGGTLAVGPRPGGGFEVRALLPFHEREHRNQPQETAL